MNYTINRILAPTDFSDHSLHALNYAETFARRWNAELHLINVIEPTVFPTEAGLTPIGLVKLTEELEAAGQKHLARLKDSAQLQGIEVFTGLVRGRASSGIIDYAKERLIDMIIIATHGRTGLEHLIFGSTAERVVREAPCPVLTVRPYSDADQN